MSNLIKRAKYVLNGEDGASTMEIIVWFSVVLMIATVLWAFKDSVLAFVNKVIDTIGAFKVA